MIETIALSYWTEHIKQPGCDRGVSAEMLEGCWPVFAYSDRGFLCGACKELHAEIKKRNKLRINLQHSRADNIR